MPRASAAAPASGRTRAGRRSAIRPSRPPPPPPPPGGGGKRPPSAPAPPPPPPLPEDPERGVEVRSVRPGLDETRLPPAGQRGDPPPPPGRPRRERRPHRRAAGVHE